CAQSSASRAFIRRKADRSFVSQLDQPSALDSADEPWCVAIMTRTTIDEAIAIGPPITSKPSVTTFGIDETSFETNVTSFEANVTTFEVNVTTFEANVATFEPEWSQ